MRVLSIDMTDSWALAFPWRNHASAIADWAVGRSLPVYPDSWTSWVSAATSQKRAKGGHTDGATGSALGNNADHRVATKIG